MGVATVAMVMSGCGSGVSPAHEATLRERAAARARALVLKRETVAAEVSDLSPGSSCEEWIATSKPARELYLLKNWPHLHAGQAVDIAHVQSLGCRAEPAHRARTAMGPLQAPVDVVVLGFARFYEEAVAEGSRQSVASFYENGVLGALHMQPAKSHSVP